MNKTLALHSNNNNLKLFRRIEKMVEKPKNSGKFKKITPWRKLTYTLKEGEKWSDEWSFANGIAPKKGSFIFNGCPNDNCLSLEVDMVFCAISCLIERQKKTRGYKAAILKLYNKIFLTKRLGDSNITLRNHKGLRKVIDNYQKMRKSVADNPKHFVNTKYITFDEVCYGSRLPNYVVEEIQQYKSEFGDCGLILRDVLNGIAKKALGEIWFRELRKKNKDGKAGLSQAYAEVEEYVRANNALPRNKDNRPLYRQMAKLKKDPEYNKKIEQLKQDIDRDDSVLKALHEIRKTASLIINDLDVLY